MGNALQRLLHRTVTIEEAKLERPLDPRLRMCAMASSGVAVASLVFFVVRESQGTVRQPDLGFFFLGNALVSGIINFLGSPLAALIVGGLLILQLSVIFLHYYRGAVRPLLHKACGVASVAIAGLALFPMATLVGLVALHAALWVAAGIAMAIVGFIGLMVLLSSSSSS
ncbi:MAG: hypothetical protein DCC46_02030 [Armatimonadetes bacterium]|nr:MAG: hypothetical protein DCC46_02030 [Armatimonadota bacterium]